MSVKRVHRPGHPRTAGLVERVQAVQPSKTGSFTESIAKEKNNERIRRGSAFLRGIHCVDAFCASQIWDFNLNVVSLFCRGSTAKRNAPGGINITYRPARTDGQRVRWRSSGREGYHTIWMQLCLPVRFVRPGTGFRLKKSATLPNAGNVAGRSQRRKSGILIRSW